MADVGGGSCNPIRSPWVKELFLQRDPAGSAAETDDRKLFFSSTWPQVDGLGAKWSSLETVLAAGSARRGTNEIRCDMKDGRGWPSVDFIRQTPPWNQRKGIKLFLSFLVPPG